MSLPLSSACHRCALPAWPGPGIGDTLLPQIISEGISSVFDEAAFPGPPNPWDHAISPSQECTLWGRAQAAFGGTGRYDVWMFGGYGVPHWTGFTIGYASSRTTETGIRG